MKKPPIAKRLRHASKVLSLSMLIMGGCGIIYEYTLGVLGNNLMGSSHEQIFVVIGIMMFAMGVGSAGQRRVVGSLVDTFVAIELLLGFLGGVATIVVYAVFVHTASFLVALFGFAFVIGVLIGLEIPIAIRINTEYSKSLRVNLSDILTMDYVGSLIGALLFAYVLLTHVSIGRIGVALGVVNTLLALGVLVFFWPLVQRKALLTAGCLLSLGILGTVFTYADQWMAQLEQRCFADPIVYRETTKYQHLVLTRRDDRVNFYINGHLQFSSRDEAIYHELLVHVPMTLAHCRERVLILGGGDGLALREVLRYGDVQSVTLVDIDPGVTRLASNHPDLIRLNAAAFHDARVQTPGVRGVLPGDLVTIHQKSKLARKLLDQTEYPLAEVRVFNIDADTFIQNIEEGFDIVILDFPDPRGVELAKLFSVDFYRALSRKLAPGAVFSVQASSPFFAKKVFLCIGKSLQTAGLHALPYHENVPSFGEWGWYLAWREGVDVESMRSRIQDFPRIPVETTYLTMDLLRGAFIFGKGWLDGVEDVQANTKMRPALVRYYRQAGR